MFEKKNTSLPSAFELRDAFKLARCDANVVCQWSGMVLNWNVIDLVSSRSRYRMSKIRNFIQLAFT